MKRCETFSRLKKRKNQNVHFNLHIFSFTGRFSDEHSVSLSVFHRQANIEQTLQTPAEENDENNSRDKGGKSVELRKKEHEIELLSNELRYLKKINEELKKKQRQGKKDFDCTKNKVAKCEVNSSFQYIFIFSGEAVAQWYSQRTIALKDTGSIPTSCHCRVAPTENQS